MTRRDRIIILLQHYVDVEAGLQDRAFRSDDFLPRMCRAWSHPSYEELRRLIAVMQDDERSLYWHLSQTYFKYEERRVSWCPRCTTVYPVAMVGTLHKHGRHVPLEPKIIRTHLPTKKIKVELAIDWLASNFIGEPFVPDDLLALVA